MIEAPSSMPLILAAPYLALAAASVAMSRDLRARPRWEYLWAFGGLFALHFWVPLIQALSGFASLQWFSSLLLGLAYVALFEFARYVSTSEGRFARWITWAVLLGTMGMVLAGSEPWRISLFVGLPSGLLALLALRDPRYDLVRWGRRCANLLGLALLLTPAALLYRDLLHGRTLAADVALFTAGLLATGATVLLDAWQTRRQRKMRFASNYLVNAASVALALGALLAGGTMVARLLSDTERQELRSATLQDNVRIATMIKSARDVGMQMADSISGSPLVTRRFVDHGTEAIAGANNIVDRYRQSFNCDIVYLIDPQGIVITTSNRDRPDSLIGANLADRDYFQQAMAGIRCAAVRLGGVTGRRGIYAAAPVRGPGDSIVGVVAVKSELESLEQRLGDAGSAVLVDPSGMIWLCARPNWRYQRLWGRGLPVAVPATDRVVRPQAGLTAFPDRPLEAGEIVLLDGEPCEVSRIPAGLDGWSVISFTSIRPALRTGSAALLITGCGMLVLLGAATTIRLRSQHASMQQEEQSLSSSLKEMERLMSVLSHDLRTPLAAAQCSAEYLLALDQFKGEPREALEMIAEQQMRMADMVGRMLDAIRIRNGAMEWSWENVAVQAVLQSAHRVVASLPTRSTEVAIEVDGKDAPAVIRGDAQAITRLVTNLATNAVRHTKRGSVRIGAYARQQNGARWLVIETTDTGGGIAPEVLPLLGRPFVLGARHGGSGGSGLGLAIAAGICAVHGGRLSVRSEVGRGTTFTAWLRTDLDGPIRSAGEPTIHVENAAS